ncbi:PREDICTED: matrix metalloproteinase-2 isoform X2 [Rhagoletis zephyria]|nr:PREDICTED: matrix metalloproteinase-2 isoform X2 [Rhagoletis zephyria]
MEFDYLPKSDIETGALRTEEQLKDAIRNLQRFGNIPATGEIDEATRKLIQLPRCGVGDSNRTANFSPDNLQYGYHRMKRYVLQGPKWDKTDLTWSLVNWTMDDSPQVRRVLTEALNVWARSSKLTFREVLSDQADIQVLFARGDHGDGYKFDGPGMVLAHAFYPGVGRGGDAHFDADEKWQFSSGERGDTTNFLGVAVHEFGHSLGLGHSSDKNAIMYPWYHDNDVDINLPDDDRYAIQQLYGAKEKTWGPFKPQPRPQTTPTTTTTTRRPLVYYPQYPQQPQYPSYDPYYPRRQYPYNPHHRNREPVTTSTTTTTYRPRTDSPPRPTKNWSQRRHPTKPKKLKPDTCQTSYDAISIIRREIFIFRGQFLWRIGDRGLYEGFPTETRRLWTQLPENYTKIDAVYENQDRKIVFFIGRYYYVFDSVTLVRGYPQPLTSLGLPPSLTHIDAAFVWGHNNRTYFTSGTLYWRLDDETGRVELDYPRDMSIWRGVGYNIDAAFQYSNRKTYFFKGYGYWEFNDDVMEVAHPRPKLSARKWMNCQRRVNEVDEEQTWTAPLISERNDTINPDLTGGISGIRNHAGRWAFLWNVLLPAICWWWSALATID